MNKLICICIGPLLFNLFINDIVSLFSSNCLLYADDLKICDAILLQYDLSMISCWCAQKGTYLNVDKCNCISFHHKSFPIVYDYKICNSALKRVKEIRDLGVIFDREMSFKPHVEYITSRDSMMLGFIKRSCREFSDPYVLKSLY